MKQLTRSTRLYSLFAALPAFREPYYGVVRKLEVAPEALEYRGLPCAYALRNESAYDTAKRVFGESATFDAFRGNHPEAIGYISCNGFFFPVLSGTIPTPVPVIHVCGTCGELAHRTGTQVVHYARQYREALTAGKEHVAYAVLDNGYVAVIVQ